MKSEATAQHDADGEQTPTFFRSPTAIDLRALSTSDSYRNCPKAHAHHLSKIETKATAHEPPESSWKAETYILDPRDIFLKHLLVVTMV